MVWSVLYHPEVQVDLRRLGRTDALNILRVIDERLARGEPDKAGKSLSGDLAGYRRLRTGKTRIVYRVYSKRIEVLVIAVGQRRDDEVYIAAEKRQR